MNVDAVSLRWKAAYLRRCSSGILCPLAISGAQAHQQPPALASFVIATVPRPPCGWPATSTLPVYHAPASRTAWEIAYLAPRRTQAVLTVQLHAGAVGHVVR